MHPETKNCQNCKSDFIIDSVEISFYQKVGLPMPTWCHSCKRQRRLSYRNTHALYKRKDSFKGQDIISIYSPDKNLVVIDQKDWWADGWDAMDYGRDYDFSVSFFEQWKDFRDHFPLQSLSNSKAVNSDYCNVAEENYDCYLCSACYKDERAMYCDSVSYIKDSLDLHVVHRSDFCYECVNCADSYELRYSQDSFACTSSSFLYDCRGCTDCFMSSNLRSKSYVFRNQQLSKQDYDSAMAQIDFGNREVVCALHAEFQSMYLDAIHRYARITNSPHSTGHNIVDCKNVVEGFDVTDGLEDSAYVFWGGMRSHEVFDVDAVAELDLSYEVFDVGVGGSHCFFCNVVYYSTYAYYSFNCYSCTNIFACYGLRNKQYCIFNKQYTKEEYFDLVEKIKNHMNTMPYVNTQGHEYRFGEFFPMEFSPFAYNETVANDFFPLSQQTVQEKGLSWYQGDRAGYNATLGQDQIPVHITDVDSTILSEVLFCHQNEDKRSMRCPRAFKILENELSFYKRFNIPIPDTCYQCRHMERFRKRTPLQLFKRTTIDDVEVMTPYAPDRPEKIYSEKGYQDLIL